MPRKCRGVKTEAREIAQHVKVVLPDQGHVAERAIYGVVVTSVMNGGVENNSYVCR